MKSFASTKDAGKFERNVDKEFPDKRAFAYEEGNVMVDENSRVTCFYCRKVLAITCFGSHFTRFVNLAWKQKRLILKKLGNLKIDVVRSLLNENVTILNIVTSKH